MTEKYEVRPCPCGFEYCKKWIVWPLAPEATFEERQARTVAAVLNALENPYAGISELVAALHDVPNQLRGVAQVVQDMHREAAQYHSLDDPHGAARWVGNADRVEKITAALRRFQDHYQHGTSPELDAAHSAAREALREVH